MSGVPLKKRNGEKTMVKLYFKKLLTVALCALICFLFVIINILVLSDVFDAIENPLLKLIAIFAFPISLTTLGVFLLRIRKKNLREDYLEKANKAGMTFANEMKYMFGFPQFLTELLAYGTPALLIPFALIMATSDNLIVKIILVWIAFLILMVPYFAIDLVTWILVHAVWRKSGESAQSEMAEQPKQHE